MVFLHVRLSWPLFFPPLVHGLRDLFWLPIEQYRKDGRIIRGLQRGAASFGTSTASAALELSNRLVQAIQVRTLPPIHPSTAWDRPPPTPALWGGAVASMEGRVGKGAKGLQ